MVLYIIYMVSNLPVNNLNVSINPAAEPRKHCASNNVRRFYITIARDVTRERTQIRCSGSNGSPRNQLLVSAPLRRRPCHSRSWPLA